MAKTKISTNEIKEITKFHKGEDKVVEISKSDTETIPVTIHTSISYEDYAQLVTDIINGSFDKNDEYIPFAQQASFDINLVKYFTNIKVDNVKVIYEFVQNTNIIALIYDVIGEDFFFTLEDDVRDGLDYRKQKIYHTSKWESVAETLNEFLSGLINNINDSAEKFKNIDVKQITELANKLSGNSDNIAVNAVMNKLDEPENISDKIVEIESKFE